MGITRKERNKLRYTENKELIKLAWEANQKLKKYVMVGKLKVVVLPADTIEALHEKFNVDETSKTGLRWSESSINKPCLRGREAGCLSPTVGYYYVRVMLSLANYRLSVARIVWMMVNNRLIEPGLYIDHKNRKRNDNRIANLDVSFPRSNSVNRSGRGLSLYKNVMVNRQNSKPRFYVKFTFLGVRYVTARHVSEAAALILGWELITSGEVPLEYIKSQSNEWQDGTYLQRALAECEKQGIAVTPPKFKTLYEYIAFVENNVN